MKKLSKEWMSVLSSDRSRIMSGPVPGTKGWLAVFAAVVAFSTFATVVEYGDLKPADNQVVNDFWNCTAHTCLVERVESSVAYDIAVSGKVMENSSVSALETRSFVDEISDWFGFSTFKRGLLLLFR